jgi:hypothetical protein
MNHRRRLLTALLTLLPTVLAACRGGTRGATPLTITLVVENRGFYDANVYAVRSAGSSGARIGTINGNTTKIFRVRDSDLQAGGLMVLQVRAIGGRTSWTSPALLVDTRSVARLDIVSSGTDLSQSQLYLQP